MSAPTITNQVRSAYDLLCDLQRWSDQDGPAAHARHNEALGKHLTELAPVVQQTLGDAFAHDQRLGEQFATVGPEVTRKAAQGSFRPEIGILLSTLSALLDKQAFVSTHASIH